MSSARICELPCPLNVKSRCTPSSMTAYARTNTSPTRTAPKTPSFRCKSTRPAATSEVCTAKSAIHEARRLRESPRTCWANDSDRPAQERRSARIQEIPPRQSAAPYMERRIFLIADAQNLIPTLRGPIQWLPSGASRRVAGKTWANLRYGHEEVSTHEIFQVMDGWTYRNPGMIDRLKRGPLYC